MSSPAVVHVSHFTGGTSDSFNSYLEYMDRDEAVRTEAFDEYNIHSFDGYNNYMGNPEKSSGLFNHATNKLNANEKQTLKQQFVKAQLNDSVMWQDVISFDNKWLEEMGIYDSNKELLDEKRIMNVVREGMVEILEKEKMSHSAVWAGAIHYNTDNIHVHVAIVEPEPTRPYQTFKREDGTEYTARRGSRKKGSLDVFRSKVANRLLDRDKELAELSFLIRDRIGNRQVVFRELPDRKIQRLYGTIFNDLPFDKRLWKYNNNAMNNHRPMIDDLVSIYIDTYHKEDMKTLLSQLDEEVAFRKKLYGEGSIEKGRYKDYKENKLNELYSRLGNTLLKDMSEFDNELKKDLNKKFFLNHKKGLHSQESITKKINGQAFRGHLKQLKKNLAKDVDHQKNQQRYEELQQDIEQSR